MRSLPWSCRRGGACPSRPVGLCIPRYFLPWPPPWPPAWPPAWAPPAWAPPPFAAPPLGVEGFAPALLPGLPLAVPLDACGWALAVCALLLVWPERAVLALLVAAVDALREETVRVRFAPEL